MSWLRRHWKALCLGAGVFLAGLAIGAGGGTATEATTETVTESVTESETVTETETVDPTAEDMAALEEREAELDDRQAELRERERTVARRERRVKLAEAVQARSRFDDGVYLVGKDVPAGSYRAPGGTNCYWARLENGSQEIIDNHLGSGQVRATIYRGELFETSGCGTWRRG